MSDVSPAKPGQFAPSTAWTTVRHLAAMPEVPFSEAAIRQQIARAERNGLKPHVRRIGRRVLINLPGYFSWIEGEGRNRRESTSEQQ